MQLSAVWLFVYQLAHTLLVMTLHGIVQSADTHIHINPDDNTN